MLLKTENMISASGLFIETVKKDIVSIPTQIGCSGGCSFCISKEAPVVRNLTIDEMVNLARSAPVNNGKKRQLSFTGEGEPILNWKRCKQVVSELKDEFNEVKFSWSGFASSALKNLEGWALPIKLQISLYSAIQQKRDLALPKRDSLQEMKSNVFWNAAPYVQSIIVNWVLIKDENDTMEDLLAIKNWVPPTWEINLSPLLGDVVKRSKNQQVIGDLLECMGYRVNRFNEVGVRIDSMLQYTELTYKDKL